ncbi:Histidinol-phosphate transaminase [Nitritalea halalkaliphila LW7]|uniref:Histidinol-phosphate transaminase n=2 Tax=Nitritalea TaxID=1187887 RepID=I5C4P5_9BACT|nr:Histidinol-phosphate transaminase [Nitritalea halalkaliphila LW7]
MRSSLLAAGAMTFGFNHFTTQRATAKTLVREIVPNFNMEEPRILAKLNSNENAFGPAPEVIKAIVDSASMGNRYGHGDAATLIKMLAEKEGVAPENILLGPGSTDLLEKTAIVQFMGGGNVVSADVSYMSLMNTAQRMGGVWKPVALTSDYAHDLSAMQAAIDSETKLVYICNPNNPTGSITDAAALKTFCKQAAKKTPVFVDEAYLEFMVDPEAQTMAGLVKEGHDVMVARTFSKIHGMAGLRIGYLVATPERIEKITSMVRGTMGLCLTSLKGAIASVQQESFLAKCRDWNTESREFTTEAVKGLGYSFIPSYTSFLIFPIAMESQPFMRGMYGKGVAVKTYNLYDKTWCRVSMGTMDEMKLFVESFKQVTA